MPIAIARPKPVAASAAARVGLGRMVISSRTAAITQPTEPTIRASRARSAAESTRVHWVVTAKPGRPSASAAVVEPTPAAPARSTRRKNCSRAGPPASSVAAPTTETTITVRTETDESRAKPVASPTRRSSDRCGNIAVISGTTSTAKGSRYRAWAYWNTGRVPVPPARTASTMIRASTSCCAPTAPSPAPPRARARRPTPGGIVSRGRTRSPARKDMISTGSVIAATAPVVPHPSQATAPSPMVPMVATGGTRWA